MSSKKQFVTSIMSTTNNLHNNNYKHRKQTGILLLLIIIITLLLSFLLSCLLLFYYFGQTIKSTAKNFCLFLLYIVVCKQFLNRFCIVRASSHVSNRSADDVLTALASIPQFSQ